MIYLSLAFQAGSISSHNYIIAYLLRPFFFNNSVQNGGVNQEEATTHPASGEVNCDVDAMRVCFGAATMQCVPVSAPGTIAISDLQHRDREYLASELPADSELCPGNLPMALRPRPHGHRAMP